MDTALGSTAVISLLAVAAPLLARSVQRVAIPSIVVELLLGLAAGPHGLGWIRLDGAVNTLALLGVTFLFFLAGLEVDLSKIRGRLLGRSLVGYVLGLAIALVISVALDAGGLLRSPALVAVSLGHRVGAGGADPAQRGPDHDSGGVADCRLRQRR